MTATARRVREALRWRVPITDPEFDQLFATPVRAMSAMHWTPVEVAMRAAALLAPEPGMRVLDVGAGAGKLCCVGALATEATRACWIGVERDSALVSAATALASRLRIADRVSFTCGDMSTVEWKDFDSLYFFNPFEALLFGSEPCELPHRWTLFANELDRVTAALIDLPSGTRVVTYQGFGGEMPGGYVLAEMERIGSGQLALWVKRARRRPTYRVARDPIGGPA